MRKVILQEFVSLDGLAAGPDGSVDFVPASVAGDQSFGQRQLDFMQSIDAILLGRVTYGMFSQYWPNVTSGEDREFAERINAIPKVVFSSTLQDAPWGSFEPARLVREDAASEVRKAKQESGRDMVVWGSISLARSLTRSEGIDEYQLIICPVVLGTGRSVFGDLQDSLPMSLVSTRSFDRGAVLLAYERGGGGVA